MSITQRIDAITGLPPVLEAKAPIPRSVKIELTGRCNFQCSFCARSMHLRDQGDMDKLLFERLLIEMRMAGVDEIGLFYLGESMLLPWLEKAIEFAKHTAKYPYVFLTTNGSLATPSRVEKMFRAGLDSLKFSLNYADANQFEQISGMPGRIYPQIVANIKLARRVRDDVEQAAGHHCSISGSYIAYDGEQGERMKAVVAELAPYLDEIYALPLYGQGGFVTEKERALGWKVSPGNRGRLEKLRPPIPCWAIWNEGHITFDGKLSACCFDHNSAWEMGDLTKQSFVEAWNSASFTALRASHLRGEIKGTPCENCLI